MLRAQERLPAATETYNNALAVSPDWSNTVAIRRSLADLALAQGDARGAVAQYDALRGKEATGAWAAEMHYLAGAALAKGALFAIFPGPTPIAGTTPAPTPPLVELIGEAQARWRAAVAADVTSKYAHSAIVALLDSGAAVDEYPRAGKLSSRQLRARHRRL